MVKVKDYPFTITIEKKLSKNNNPYTSIGIGITSVKDKNAQGNDKYKTDWINLIDKRDLLKFGKLCLTAYDEWVAWENKPQSTSKKTVVVNHTGSYPDMDDDIPFGA